MRDSTLHMDVECFVKCVCIMILRVMILCEIVFIKLYLVGNPHSGTYIISW